MVTFFFFACVNKNIKFYNFLYLFIDQYNCYRLLVSQNSDYKIIPEYDNYHGLLVNDAFMKICNMINDSSVIVRTKVSILIFKNNKYINIFKHCLF